MFHLTLLQLLLAAGCLKCEQLTQQASVALHPGQQLAISCQVSYSVGNYHTHWIRQPSGKGKEWIGGARVGYNSYQKDSLKNKFSYSLDSSSNIVTLKGLNMQPEDSAVYYCARQWGAGRFDYWGKGTTVTVTSATPTAPSLFPLAPCGSGGSDMVTLGCLASGFNPSTITFSWKQGSTSLDSIIQYPSIQKGSEYIGISQVQVSRQEWDARKSFKCVLDHVTGEKHASIVKPDMVYEPPTLKVSSYIDEGKDETYYSCFAKDFSPNKYEIKWMKDDQYITGKIDEVITSSQGRNDTNGTMLYSVASLLTMPSAEVPEDSTIKCLFTGKGERDTVVQRNATVPKQYMPVGQECSEADVDVSIIPPSNEDIFTKGKGEVICQVTVKKGKLAKIVWLNETGGELVSTNLIEGSRVHKAKIELTYDEWFKGVKRVCVVYHKDWLGSLRREYNRNNGGTSKRPSVFMLPPVEQTRENTVVLTCYVKDFSPKEIYVSWLVDDEEVGTKYPFSTTEPVKNNGYYSVYSQLILTQDEWEQTDVVYSCSVYHETLANSIRSIVRSIGFRTSDKTNVVNLSMNVPEKCTAQ